MLITKDNYEIYAIDYIDGALDKEVQAEMDRFLDRHPLIKSEIDAMMDFPTLEADQEIIYSKKSTLKQPENKRTILPLLKYAAAIGLLIVATFAMINQSDNEATPELAQNEETNSSSNLPTNQEGSSSRSSLPADQEASNSNYKEIKQESFTSNNGTSNTSINGLKKEPTTSPNMFRTKASKSSTSFTAASESKLMQDLKEGNGTSFSKIEQETLSNNIDIPAPNTKPDVLPDNKLIASAIEPIPLKSDLQKIEFNTPAPSMIDLEKAFVKVERKAKKSSWLLNAITTKSDGTKVFAFTGVKRALTPSNYRDRVDRSNDSSPSKTVDK